MNLQIREAVETYKPDAVLNALDRCLREISIEVVRSGHQLIASGIGPSHRIKNPNDKAILQVSFENSATIIQGDATFQASALLGDQPQDSIVRSKFETVFNCVRAQLSHSGQAPAAGETALETASKPLPQSTPPVHAPSPADSASPTVPADILPAIQAGRPGAITEQNPEAVIGPTNPQIAPPLLRSASTTGRAKPQHTGILAAGVLVCCLGVVLLMLTPLLHRTYRTYIAERSATPHSSQALTEAAPSSITPGSKNVHPSSASYPPPASTTLPKRTAPTAVPPPSIPADPALSTRVQNWGAAIRSRNAAAQASFYAARVSPYLQDQEADRAFILRDKQASIQLRQGLWTVRLDNIAINQDTPSTATVSLIQHIIEKTNDSPVSERLVPTQLRFERTAGQWYITSERDLHETTLHP